MTFQRPSQNSAVRAPGPAHVFPHGALSTEALTPILLVLPPQVSSDLRAVWQSSKVQTLLPLN